MKRRFGIGIVLGQKSSSRYPRIKDKTEPMKFVLPSQVSLNEPPVSTNLTLKRANVIEINQDFIEKSQDIEEGFPVRIQVMLSSNGFSLEIGDITCFTLFYGFLCESTETMRRLYRKGRKLRYFITNIYNMALVKFQQDEEEEFSYPFLLFPDCKNILATYRSYEFKLFRPIRNFNWKFLKFLKKKFQKKKGYVLSKKFLFFGKKIHNKHLYKHEKFIQSFV